MELLEMIVMTGIIVGAILLVMILIFISDEGNYCIGLRGCRFYS